jgi:hypothetical protein
MGILWHWVEHRAAGCQLHCMVDLSELCHYMMRGVTLGMLFLPYEPVQAGATACCPARLGMPHDVFSSCMSSRCGLVLPLGGSCYEAGSGVMSAAVGPTRRC